MIVNDFLMENFSEIVDYHFTAEVEEQFDEIALGNLKWTGMIQQFYSPFHKTVTNTLEKKERKTWHKAAGKPSGNRRTHHSQDGQVWTSGPDRRFGER